MADEQGPGIAGGTGIAGAMDYRPRTPGRGETVSPVAEVAPGVFRLRAIVEAEARGRAAGLREAAGVANQHAAAGAGHYAGTAILALLDGAAVTTEAQMVQAMQEAYRQAHPIVEHLDGAAAGDADDGWNDEAGKRINSLIGKLEAARARIAELERSVEMLCEAQSQALRDAEIDGRRSGAEAMREAAAKVCQRSGKHAAHNISTASEGMKMWFDGAMSGAAAIEENIRALPLPGEDAGDE